MIIYKYKKNIEDFLIRKITVDEFQTLFFKTFKAENGRMDQNLFEILNDIFEAADCYWHECHPGEETNFETSEEQLRKEVADQLVELNNLII